MCSSRRQSFSFLSNLARLPPELLDRILQLSLFSTLHRDEFHSVLHMTMLLSQVKSFPRFRRNLIGFMETEWLRKEIQKQCNLYNDYDSVYQDRQKFLIDWMLRHPKRAKDPVSWTILECPSCFRFLLYYRVILPSYYNHDGESFLYTALIHRNKTIAKLLACGLTAKGLASPLWFTGGKVGPSALDIALSDDIVVTRDAPWDDSDEYGKHHFDHHTFMYAVLKKHPRKREIEPAYLAQFNRKHPGFLRERVYLVRRRH